MSSLPKSSTLKEVNALKKKLNWGEVPAIYQMVSASIGNLDGILTHGFDSAYKQLLNKNNWNLNVLGGYKDTQGNIHVKIKPLISLKHVFNEVGYELHCYPVIEEEKVNGTLNRESKCQFINWTPETMRMLFRINSLVAFSIFSYQSGDEADLALLRYAFHQVENLINILNESFEIVDIKGYSIAEFYQEIDRRQGNILDTDFINTPIE
jgi:hypothetical protein